MFAAPSRPLHRRASATAAAAVLVVAGGALSSCGFNEPTDRVNTIAAGTNERDASVDALGMRVLSTAPGEGRLIGTLVNNEAGDAALTEVSGEGVSAELEPIEIPGAGRVNLSDPTTPPIPLTGEFVAGQVITLDLGFDVEGAGTVVLDVPVVKDCFQYTQVPEPEAVESEVAEEESADEEAEAGEIEAEESESAPVEASENPAYLCDHPTVGHETAEQE